MINTRVIKIGGGAAIEILFVDAYKQVFISLRFCCAPSKQHRLQTSIIIPMYVITYVYFNNFNKIMFCIMGKYIGATSVT